MLGKLPVVGRPTNLVSIRARTYCACIRSGWALFLDIFSVIYLFFPFSLFGRRADID